MLRVLNLLERNSRIIVELKREAIERGARAARLSTLTVMGLKAMADESIAASTFTESARFIQKNLSERSVEDELMWLFRVGLVRREVDGQGITDRFRLTPLGQRVVQELEAGPLQPLGLGDQLNNWFTRLLPS
jgi:DNA-binding transcriptional ArsR family regulator